MKRSCLDDLTGLLFKRSTAGWVSFIISSQQKHLYAFKAIKTYLSPAGVFLPSFLRCFSSFEYEKHLQALFCVWTLKWMHNIFPQLCAWSACGNINNASLSSTCRLMWCAQIPRIPCDAVPKPTGSKWQQHDGLNTKRVCSDEFNRVMETIYDPAGRKTQSIKGRLRDERDTGSCTKVS